MIDNHIPAGVRVDRHHPCEECNGTGYITEKDGDGQESEVECGQCRGRGYYEKWS